MLTHCFNPHSHMGSDKQHVSRCYIQEVSIHTPTWGVTLSLFPLPLFFSVSIHTPTWGVTQKAQIDGLKAQFQSTLPHGE